MNWTWLSCVINIGNMAHMGGSLSEHWLPSTACRIMRCSSHLEATFVLSLFAMNLFACLVCVQSGSLYPLWAGPKRAVQQAWKRSESTIVNLCCTVSIHIIPPDVGILVGENNSHVPQILPAELSSAPLHPIPPKAHVAKAGTVRRRIQAKQRTYAGCRSTLVSWQIPNGRAGTFEANAGAHDICLAYTLPYHHLPM